MFRVFKFHRKNKQRVSKTDCAEPTEPTGDIYI